jgi:2'-5' RNA ligase
MRLFLGIDVPTEIKHFLAQSYGPIQFSPKGWELPHDYHLTLLFIGETDQTDEIIRRMQKIKAEPFNLKLRTLEFFPRRILYQSFYPSPELMLLRNNIENEFTEWVNPEAKPFTPHLTVKRFQRYEFEQLQALIKAHPFPERNFKVNHLCLFKSERNQESQKYHVIHRQVF